MARQAYLPRPWPESIIELTPTARHHLFDVLRRRPGGDVTYTDGEGMVGRGTLGADHVVRGEEHSVARPEPAVCMAVAPPRPRERQRFLVEKLTELGVDQIIWLGTARRESRAPRTAKAAAWVGGALEQSGGAWAPQIRGPVALQELEGEVWIAESGGEPVLPPGGSLTIAVGPEGGWAPGELRPAWPRLGLGATILRTETAAVAAAVIALAQRRW